MESAYDSLWIKVNNLLPLWSLRSEKFNQDSLGAGIHTDRLLSSSKRLPRCSGAAEPSHPSQTPPSLGATAHFSGKFHCVPLGKGGCLRGTVTKNTAPV